MIMNEGFTANLQACEEFDVRKNKPSTSVRQPGLCKGISLMDTDVPVCLVGNKQDLCHARQVREDEGRSLAQENRCHFQEVSAADSYQDIANLFTQLIRQVMDHLKYRADRRRYSGSKSMAKLINNVFGKRRKSV
ncbi:hypothetical protein XENOCAPTIV_008610 [Xenoophorus captivus]|uniref:small monomeric GTPase n=1 Tax=Xenoophorus captivus TaxID=1517983 RepID=A0ABV0R7Q9_9TELE